MKRFGLLSLTAAAGLVLVWTAACQAGAAARPPVEKTSSSETKVAAEGEGVSITFAELDKQAAGRLAQVRQQEYEIRKDVLDQLIGDALVAKEAKARGVSVEDLLQKEVNEKVAHPTKEAVDGIYEQYKSRMGGQTREQAGPQIEKMLHDRDTALRRESYRRELQGKAGVKVALDPPRTDVPIPADAPVIGAASAPITLVEFTDYQCPYCHRAQTTIDRVLTEYSGKVRFVHRDFPLEGHSQAFPAARAAMCAGDQGKFWEYHRSLMTVAGNMSDADLATRAEGLKLDPSAFKTCVASDRHDPLIRDGLDTGVRLGVTGTPGYFINGRMLSGALPFDQFRQVIDAELGQRR